MEKILRKWAIYGFLFGLALSLLLVDNKVITRDQGGSITENKPVFDYILSLLRYSIVSMFLGLYLGWRSMERKKEKKEKRYYLEFFLIVFILAIISSLLFDW